MIIPNNYHTILAIVIALVICACNDSSNDNHDTDTYTGSNDTDTVHGDSDSTIDTARNPLPEPPAPDYEITGNMYYVDAVNGDDANPGTSESPFATLTFTITVVQGGDGIILRDGEYGDFIFGADDAAPVAEVFDDWVTIKADSGHTPTLDTVELGIWNRNGYLLEFNEAGNSNLRLRLDGLLINNGITVAGSRHVDLRNCIIQQEGAIADLDPETGCMSLMNGQYITVTNCEITNCAVGASLMTRDLVFSGNEIHHTTHDGIKLYGGENMLIANNVIHDLDDGLNDDDDDPTGRNRHVDGLHMHTIIHQGGYDNPRWAGGATNVTIRGNLFYHIESMDVMINQNEWDGIWGAFVFENNIFAPATGRMFILGSSFERIVFRHNTVLFTPSDIWQSHFGRSMGDAAMLANPYSAYYHVQVWGNPAGNEFYNNILAAASADLVEDEGIVSNNLFFSSADDVPHSAVDGSITDYLNSGNRPGALENASPAIDAGSAVDTIFETDIYGTARDAAPDIGAVEWQEES